MDLAEALTSLPAVIGALVLLVPGGIFAALRYNRDDDTAVVEQSAVVSGAAVDVIGALRSELEHTRDDLSEEREARRELAGEVRELRRELSDGRVELAATNEALSSTRIELGRTIAEVASLRRTLAARGMDD